MSDQYLGEIRIFPFNFAPSGWALCNGQLLPITQNTALFAIIGTYYGGNGVNTFGLPNLQAALSIHQGQAPGLSPYIIGEASGSDTVVLSQAQMPVHTHQFLAFEGRSRGPHANPLTNDAVAGASGTSEAYAAGPANTAMSGGQLSPYGGSQGHDNRMPSLAMSFCIALQGVFPTRG